MAVIDTNVLLVANHQHPDVSPSCVEACVQALVSMQLGGTVVIDDGFRLLQEYQHKTRAAAPRGVGDVFLKWLLRNLGNPERVAQVTITELPGNMFAEFPAPELQAEFDPSDRKFAAVAGAHPGRPPIWQAADCKWLNWWQALAAHGVRVEFLCQADALTFYRHKFPHKHPPTLPESEP